MGARLIDAGWEVAVLVPARDEEALVGRCLESIVRAMDALPPIVKAMVVVVSDCSTDRTAEVAESLIGARGRVLHTRAGRVGTARALAGSYAVANAAGSISKLWLANTDADCVVPSTWLSDQIHLAASGIEAVAGIVAVDSFEEHGVEVPGRFRASYAIYEDGSHPHIHGANLGVRADRYLAAGGWADLKTAEDHNLWARLRRTGCRVSSSAKLEVVTSGRRQGRAPDGFAAALGAHNDPVFFA